MVLDASKPHAHREILTRELESVGIRLNRKPPDIYFKKKKTARPCAPGSRVQIAHTFRQQDPGCRPTAAGRAGGKCEAGATAAAHALVPCTHQGWQTLTALRLPQGGVSFNSTCAARAAMRSLCCASSRCAGPLPGLLDQHLQACCGLCVCSGSRSGLCSEAFTRRSTRSTTPRCCSERMRLSTTSSTVSCPSCRARQVACGLPCTSSGAGCSFRKVLACMPGQPWVACCAVIEGNRKYTRCLYVYNKASTPAHAARPLLAMAEYALSEGTSLW